MSEPAVHPVKRGLPIPKETRRIVAFRSQGRCEARLFGCAFDAGEIHHLLSRGRGGSNEVDNLLHICRPCHHKITIHSPGTERFRLPSPPIRRVNCD